MTADPPLTDPASDSGESLAGSASDDGVPLAEDGHLSPVLDLAFGVDTLYALRAAVQAHAFAAGMPERRADDIVITIHELAANVIQHGAGRGRVRMWRLPGRLCFQVDDTGPLARPGGDGANPADRWPIQRGHGLWLIREIADYMSLFSGPGGTQATVAFVLPR